MYKVTLACFNFHLIVCEDFSLCTEKPGDRKVKSCTYSYLPTFTTSIHSHDEK